MTLNSSKEYQNIKPNNLRKPIEEMLAAEESNQFRFECKTEQEEEEEYFEPEEDKYIKKEEDSIANLAKKITETKLSQSPPKPAMSTEAVADTKDDDDLDIDLDLENVDTTDPCLYDGIEGIGVHNYNIASFIL
ncbi:coatomer subunit beta [Brachionus plicatilis]|uniref:Coatomer subunit beta n=1 Tax=Brachionus plicatilis TaxID=10195 RepID=A0A3M7SKK3_BRAPC|nr:coatomer subunit beta [Brachionus plicatilis]